MDNHSTAEAATAGAIVALQELGVSPGNFLKTAKTVDQLFAREDRAPVMRKVAAMVADVLDAVPSTKGRLSSNMMRLMSKSADWHVHYDDYLRDAMEPFLEKRAKGNKPGAGTAGLMAAFKDLGVPGFLALTVGSGAIGGGVAHYMGKQVDEDHIDIEKQRAVQNEYQRLADEIDRKITARALRTQTA